MVAALQPAGLEFLTRLLNSFTVAKSKAAKDSELSKGKQIFMKISLGVV